MFTKQTRDMTPELIGLLVELRRVLDEIRDCLADIRSRAPSMPCREISYDMPYKTPEDYCRTYGARTISTI